MDWELPSWIFSSFTLLVLGVFIWLKHRYLYWQRHGIEYIKPSYFVGNLGPYLRMKSSPADFIRNLYEDPKGKGKAFVGLFMFHKPAILVRDPELVKRVLIKDFNKFSNRYSNSDYKSDPLGSKNLFFLKNPAWKEVRLKLSPFFTSTKLKQMFQLIEEAASNMSRFLSNQEFQDTEERSFDLELKEFCALYTTDVIATVAFGVQANSFKHKNGEFRHYGRKVFLFNLKRAAEFTMVFFMPQLVPYLKFKIVPPDTAKFFRSTINYVIKEREKSGKVRNDLIDILLECRKSTQNQKANSDSSIVFEGDVLIAQAAIFFTAGFESSSSLMAFALYELAKSPEKQQRLRKEIHEALDLEKGQISMKMIDSMEFMHQVVLEILRMYPPLPFVDRECTVGSESSGYSLKPFADYEMPNGMAAYIPVYGIHRDPQFYPHPDDFMPERFSPENKKNLTPYTFMPFGLGPHACIGERFGILQAKIGLTHFLRQHRVAMNSQTLHEMKLHNKAIVLQAEGGIHLKVIRDPKA